MDVFSMLIKEPLEFEFSFFLRLLKRLEEVEGVSAGHHSRTTAQEVARASGGHWQSCFPGWGLELGSRQADSGSPEPQAGSTIGPV